MARKKWQKGSSRTKLNHLDLSQIVNWPHSNFCLVSDPTKCIFNFVKKSEDKYLIQDISTGYLKLERGDRRIFLV